MVSQCKVWTKEAQTHLFVFLVMTITFCRLSSWHSVLETFPTITAVFVINQARSCHLVRRLNWYSCDVTVGDLKCYAFERPTCNKLCNTFNMLYEFYCFYIFVIDLCTRVILRLTFSIIFSVRCVC